MLVVGLKKRQKPAKPIPQRPALSSSQHHVQSSGGDVLITPCACMSMGHYLSMGPPLLHIQYMKMTVSQVGMMPTRTRPAGIPSTQQPCKFVIAGAATAPYAEAIHALLAVPVWGPWTRTSGPSTLTPHLQQGTPISHSCSPAPGLSCPSGCELCVPPVPGPPLPGWQVCHQAPRRCSSRRGSSAGRPGTGG